MAGTGVKPSEFVGMSDNDIAANLLSSGVCTGFSFYNDVNLPGWDSAPVWSTLYAIIHDEGFFTGFFPRRYYSPEQVDFLGSAGVLAKIRAEGTTVGDFRPGLAVHAPGEDSYTILSNLSLEGYFTGTPEIADAADPAMTDHNCVDGRYYGSGCFRPTVYTLYTDLISAIASDSVTINLPFKCTALIFLSVERTELPLAEVIHLNNEWSAVVKQGTTDIPFCVVDDTSATRTQAHQLPFQRGYGASLGKIDIEADTPVIVTLETYSPLMNYSTMRAQAVILILGRN